MRYHFISHITRKLYSHFHQQMNKQNINKMNFLSNKFKVMEIKEDLIWSNSLQTQSENELKNSINLLLRIMVINKNGSPIKQYIVPLYNI